MAILNENDYEQIEYECFKESEFSRILNLTRLKEDNITAYADFLYTTVFSRLGISEDNISQSAINANKSRIEKNDPILNDNIDENGNKIIPKTDKDVKHYNGDEEGMIDFSKKVWLYYHKKYPKMVDDTTETIIKDVAIDYYKRRFNLPL